MSVLKKLSTFLFGRRKKAPTPDNSKTDKQTSKKLFGGRLTVAKADKLIAQALRIRNPKYRRAMLNKAYKERIPARYPLKKGYGNTLVASDGAVYSRDFNGVLHRVN